MITVLGWAGGVLALLIVAAVIRGEWPVPPWWR